MGPLRQFDALILVGISVQKKLLHFGEVALPNGTLFVNHIVIGLIGELHKLFATQVEHADGRTLGGITTVTEFQTLGTLEGLDDLTTYILTIVVGIPGGTIVIVVIAQFLMDIDLLAVDHDIKGEGRLTVLVVRILRRIGIGALELQTSPDITVADDGDMHHPFGLHAVLLFQLLDNGFWQGLGLVPVPLGIDDGQKLARIQIGIGHDDGTPFTLLPSLSVGKVETGTERGNPTASMTLTHTRGVAVGILQHLINELDLHHLVVHQHIGIVVHIPTEHILQGPTLVLLVKPVLVILRLLGFL